MAHPTYVPKLYSLPRRRRDPLNAIASGVGTAICLITASCWITTQSIAQGFAYQPALGPALLGHVYSPLEFIAWVVRFDRPGASSAVHAVFLRSFLLLVAGTVASCVTSTVLAARRIGRDQQHSDLYGSAHWATEREVAATGLLEKARGVYVGVWFDPRSGILKYLRDATALHCLAFMTTGSGKTVGLVIPTMLSWDRAAVVHDVKGEIWEKTAGWRSAPREAGGLGQSVHRFEPTAADGSSIRLNPLDQIRIGTPYEVQDVQNIAELIVDVGDRPVRGDTRFWIETAKRLITGVILHAKYDKEPRNDSLPGIAALLCDPRFADLDAFFEFLLNYEHDSSRTQAWVDTQGRPTATHPIVAQIAAQMLAMDARVKANVVTEAQSFLNLYSDPIIAANISESDLDLASLRGNDVSLYLVVQPSQQRRIRPLTRLILTQILLALFHERPPTAEPSILIMLEEMAELGSLDLVETALTLGRGYGVKLYLIAQDLGQLEQVWGQRGKSLVANCAVRIASAPNDLATAELLSRMCGTMTVRHEMRNYSGNRLSFVLGHTMATEQETQRPLLTPDEAMRLPSAQKDDGTSIVRPGKLLVFVAGHAPIYATQPLYFRDPTFLRRAMIAPPQPKSRGGESGA